MKGYLTNKSPQINPRASAYDTEKLYRFLVKFKSENDGNSPTRREIKEACDISSTSIVDWLLRKLQFEGYITFGNTSNKSRNIYIVGGKWIPPAEISL